MGDFTNNIAGLSSNQVAKIERIGRREVMPTTTKGRFLPQDIIGSSATDRVLASVGNGITITITVRSTSNVDPSIRIAACPFEITFFEAATLAAIAPGTNQIPMNVATGRYTIMGPFAMPDYQVNGKRFISTSGSYFATDGNDLVHKTSIANNSGASQDLVILFALRTIQSRGGPL